MNNDLLTVSVRSSDKTFYEGQVAAVSSINDTGPFDVLGEHENFICILKEKVVLHLQDGKSQEIPVTNGIMRVLKNKVEVFLGI